ncbi:peptide/nickel transport system substrate-binding protein [Asanoa hainanensis]|uniref:Peptide/nickel transport system substrate-binding protein n=1 Tax=Asanoa hainanensis TaxID=560556 RepID=A0A239PD16_9ACTN|nr:ABC transporter substrate-binding protein [Asanoa hainanensis]SNT64956.1 peptide/nickel transport system substrate-binding protein [Asanoa hainanensis]
MKRRMVTGVAVGVAAALALAACGGGGTDSNTDSSGGGTTTAAFDAANGKVFNPSDKKGGTMKFAISSDWDSVDPGDTYYGLSWNLARLYTRSLTMFKVGAGSTSSELTGDLAEGLGVPSDGGKTWTYKLRQGLKFEDGTPITSKDVEYGVSRSLEKSALVNGPTYFNDFLDLKGYKGPYSSKGQDNPAIDTPDDLTIVFHLNKPFGGFDYFAQIPATAPVPVAKDTGVKYKEHVVSSGPYKFESYEAGKGFKLVRNDQWDQSTDPNRKALPDGYDVTIGANADDIDNQIIDGSLDVDIAGTGVQPAALSRVLGQPDLKARADNPLSARLNYTSINPNVGPLKNIECRKAVEYAADRTTYQTAYGGPEAGGEIATGLLPPQIPGFQKLDVWSMGADNKGDLDKAKAALQACGQPNGFETNIAYRAERPKEKATAEALQQSLARVGIKLTLKPFPTGDYFSLYAGKPSYRDQNNLGLMLNSWGADWNDGFGFLSQIVDGRVIRDTGGSSNLSVNVPEINTMVDQAIAETDTAKRDALWGAIDKRVMEEAVILPGVWAKQVTVRSTRTTNVFVNDAYGMYDFLAMGIQ